MEQVKGGFMSYAKGKWEIVEKRRDMGMEHSHSLGYAVINDKDKEICVDKNLTLANAKRIIHCVNNYDGLVEALKEAEVEVNKWHSVNVADNDEPNEKIAWKCLKRIQQAIAKTEEK